MIDNNEIDLNELLLNNIGQLSAVYHLTNQLINVQDLDEYYSLLIQKIPDITGFSVIYFYMLNSFKNELKLSASTVKDNIIKSVKINSELKDPFITALTGQSKIFKKEVKYFFDVEFKKNFKFDNFAVVPLKTKKDIIGLVIFANNDDAVVETEKFDSVKLISNMAAFVYENLLLKTELEVAQNYFYDYIDIISRQFRLISVLNSAASKIQILNVLAVNVKSSLAIDYVLIFSYDEGSNSFKITHSSEGISKDVLKLSFNDKSIDDLINRAYFKREIFKKTFKNNRKTEVYGGNIKKLAGYLDIKEIVVVPLQGKEDIFNVAVFGTTEKEITTQDFDELRMFCNQVGTAIENEVLTEKIRMLNKQMHDDLTTAGNIQQSLLPVNLKKYENIKISAENIQTSYIGGDFYLVKDNNQNEIFVAIGDVSGHGPSAALIMALVMQIYSDEISKNLVINSILKNVNNRYCNSVDTDIAGFVTSFAVQINLEKNKMYYSNAGHNYPYYFDSQADTLFQLDKSNFFFGVDDETEYDVFNREINKGDILILYTDGIVEALNSQNEQFGYIRFEKVLNESISLDVHTIKNNVIKAVKKFVSSKEFNDDWTIVIVKF